MKFGFDNGPHLKDTDKTSKIMTRLFAALLPIIFFAIYKNGIYPYLKGYTDLYGALRPLLMIILGIGTSVITEIAFIYFILKKKDNWLHSLKESFAIFPGLFLVLTLPINTPLWLIVLGSFVATFIGKLLFGGFGYNVFNPALVGVLFVMSSYGALIVSHGGYLNPMEVDTISGATALSHFSVANHLGTWTSIVEPYGSLWSFFFGFIPGSLGETCKLLIILAFIYLSVTKVIKWVIPVSYVITVFFMTSIIGAMNGIDAWYPLFNILSGGLLFGAVFMATDPVTSPTTRIGQVIFGLGLGLLTVLFRYLTPYPEGVYTSILTMNMLVFVLDRIGAKAKFNTIYRYVSIAIIVVVILGSSILIGNSIKPGEKTPTNNNFKILSVTKTGHSAIYKVSQKGFHGPIEATVTIQNDIIISIDVTSQNETYWEDMKASDYLGKLIAGQSNVDKVDAFSGATISSNAFKSMITNVLDDYEVRK